MEHVDTVLVRWVRHHQPGAEQSSHSSHRCSGSLCDKEDRMDDGSYLHPHHQSQEAHPQHILSQVPCFEMHIESPHWLRAAPPHLSLRLPFGPLPFPLSALRILCPAA